MITDMTVLVTGGRGHVGALVVRGLQDAGVAVRATSRDPRAGDFPDGIDVVRADLTDPATLPGALDGVTKVFLYAHPEQIDAFTTAARTAGVQHVVLLSSASVLFPDAEGNPIARQHAAVERALDDARIDRTFLRPAYFATNALRWTSIRTERSLRTAFPEGRTTMVHERDIAEVGVRALLDDAHRGGAYALLGTGLSTVREQVRDIADALGEAVRVEQVGTDAFRDELLRHMPAAIVDRLIAQRGDAPLPPPDVTTDAVIEVLGRAPLPFAAWARDHAGDFR